MPRPVRILLVEDDALHLAIVQRALARHPDLMVVGVARDGRSALELLRTLDVHVVCTDLDMPHLDGFELVERVMAERPCPILVLCGSYDDTRAFRLLELGALDVMAKPVMTDPTALPRFADDLGARLRLLSGVAVVGRRRAGLPPRSLPPPPSAAQIPSVVVIGASTGGPQALAEILPFLPATFPAPIVCVQHISAGFLEGFVDWLARRCEIRVEVARAGAKLSPGVALFAPDHAHLLMDRDGTVRLVDEPPVEGHRPSATVTMRHAAATFGKDAMGILLSGMGTDGAAGLLRIREAGGRTLAQDEASCVVYGMPREAMARGAVEEQLSPRQIAQRLRALRSAAPLTENPRE